MRLRCITWLLVAAILAGLILPVIAEDAPTPSAEKVAVKTSVQPREVRDYSVRATLKGKAIPSGSTEAIDLDTTTTLKIRHQYQRRGEDGLLPLEISLLGGEAVVKNASVEPGENPETKIEITPALYPKLTVLLDRSWRIADVFGMPESRLADQLPGINYSNMIMLFYVPGPSEPRAVGDKWNSVVKIPSYGETYNFANTLKSVETVDGVKAAIIRQEITRERKADSPNTPTMKATVESAFSLADGKLLRSHVDCEVVTPSEKGAERSLAARATVTVDIALLRR